MFKGGYPTRHRKQHDVNDKIFYTEDNIPVNTLYVSYGGHPLDNENYVRKQFESFGEIKEIIMVNKPNVRFCFIHFKKCEDAAKVLKSKMHFKNVSRINKADSWHQDAFQYKNKTHRSLNHGESSNSQQDRKSTDFVNDDPIAQNSLLYLNDDCLLQILKHLDILELIGLRSVCHRLDALACELFSRYRQFDFEKNIEKVGFITLMEARLIFENLGPYIICLKMNSTRFTLGNFRLLNLISKFCYNLKELHLDGFVLKPDIYREYHHLFQTLEGLALKNCHVNDSIDKSFSIAVNLKSLDLSTNSEVTGKCLHGLVNLEHLNLESCVNIQPRNFATFCERNKKLRYLNISRCNKLNSESLSSIVRNFKDLEHIVLNSWYSQIDETSYCLLGQLEKLKKAEILFTTLKTIDDQIVALSNIESLEYLDISNSQCASLKFENFSEFKNLKELKFNYFEILNDGELLKVAKLGKFTDLHIAGCCMISDEAAIEVIKLNRQLKFFDVSCTQVSEKLVFGCLDILKNGKRRLKLKIGDTNICTEIMKNALIESSKDFIELSFDYTEGSAYGLDHSDDEDEEDDDSHYDFEDMMDEMDMWNSDYDQEFDNDVLGYGGFYYDSEDSDEPHFNPMNLFFI